MTSQTERIQKAIDLLPECFSADLIADHTKRLANIVNESGVDRIDEYLRNDLDLQDARQQLITLGETLSAVDKGKGEPGIGILYCKGSSEREDIIRAYVVALRRADTIIEEHLSIFDGDRWAKATADTFRGIGDVAGNIVKTILIPTIQGLWPILVVAGLVLVVVFFIQTKVKA